MANTKAREVVFGLAILGFVAYGFGFWQSLRAVDGFCADVGHANSAADIPLAARHWGVRYSSIPDDRVVSGRVGFAASPYTLGDYACEVKTANGKIISARVLKH